MMKDLTLDTDRAASWALDLLKLQESETQRWAPIIKASGFKAD